MWINILILPYLIDFNRDFTNKLINNRKTLVVKNGDGLSYPHIHTLYYLLTIYI